MPVTNYYSVEGELLGEKTTGGSRVDYLTDALGSVTATVDQNAQVVNTYRYKPYGKQLAKTGVGSDPKFQWVGSVGYRQTGRQYSDVYIRARHYDTSTGRWTTHDPLGYDREFNFNFYHYVKNNPTNLIDPEGLDVAPPRHACRGTIIDCPQPKYQGIADNLCEKIRFFLTDPKVLPKINRCIQASVKQGTKCPPLKPKNINDLIHICLGCLQITCNGELPDPADTSWPRKTWKPCDEIFPNSGQKETCGAHAGTGCPCKIVLCPDNITRPGANCSPGTCFGHNSDISGPMLHEMVHCVGVEHGTYNDYAACNDIFACCILSVLQKQGDPIGCCKRK